MICCSRSVRDWRSAKAAIPEYSCTGISRRDTRVVLTASGLQADGRCLPAPAFPAATATSEQEVKQVNKQYSLLSWISFGHAVPWARAGYVVPCWHLRQGPCPNRDDILLLIIPKHNQWEGKIRVSGGRTSPPVR